MKFSHRLNVRKLGYLNGGLTMGKERGAVEGWLQSLKLYFEMRNLLWVEGSLYPSVPAVAEKLRLVDQGVLQAAQRKAYEGTSREVRILRAHSHIWVLPEEDDGIGGKRHSVRVMEQIRWVYEEAGQYRVEVRIIEHQQVWEQTAAGWQLSFQHTSDELNPLHPHPASNTPDVESVYAKSEKKSRMRQTTATTVHYDRVYSLRYAELWWNHSHPRFAYLRDDCTNFISQCLWAGGLPMQVHHSRARGWWYQWDQPVAAEAWSYSWTTSDALLRYLLQIHGTKQVVSAKDLRIGDIIFYDWDGTGHYHHTTIVVDFDALGDPLVNAHTDASYHRHYRYLDSRAWSPQTRYAFLQIPTVVPPL
ncbi:hypothetical protein D2Q93_07490 [Alicyclobacillaceae bacterium I2511]|nr:hypothetical protein D2Q93_07490 [Alicyclobacillaceae bacterium I2511]